MLGLVLFNGNEKRVYFNNVEEALSSLLVLISTANFPDMLMLSYDRSSSARVHGVCMACAWRVHGVCMTCVWRV